MTEQEILKRAVYKYGPKTQEIKAVEELGELQQAICKVLLENEHGHLGAVARETEHMFEEIADVEIMLDQIRIIYSEADQSVAAWRAKKLHRLAERMGLRKWEV